MNNPNRRWTRLLAGFVAVVMGASLLAIAPAGAQLVDTSDFCQNVANESPFTDVSDADQDADGIENAANILCLATSGITVGVTPTTYQPSGNVTRRQMALFVKRFVDKANELEITDLAELPAYDGSPDFPDLPGDPAEEAVFLEAIGQLNQAGIIDGKNDGTYGPADFVTRGQMSKFIANAIEFLTGEALPEAQDPFEDDDTSVFEPFIEKLFEAGVVIGNVAGDYEPLEFVSRRQMASFLIRGLAVLFGDGDIEALPGEAPQGDSITLDGTTVEQGGDITGTVDDPGTVAQLRVVGCGLDEEVTIDNVTGDFVLTLSDFIAVGPCELEFTLTRDDGTVTTQTFTITVTDATSPPPPGTGGVDDGAPLVTGGPDLISATIFDFDFTDGASEKVDFCFDEPIALLGGTTRFELHGLDSNDSVNSFNRALVPGTNCVRAEYASGTDVESFTIAVAESDGTGIGGSFAVADFSNITNTLDATALQGSSLAEFVGRTIGPDLVDVEIDSALNQATFIFDEVVTNVNNLAGLHMYDLTGTRTNAVVPFTIASNEVTVNFPGGTDVDDATRFGVDANSVRDAAAPFNPNPEGATDGVTNRPDLISVVQAPTANKAQFDFTFDESVVIINMASFRVYVDGRAGGNPPLVAINALNVDSDTVRVTFQNPAGFSDFPNESVVLGTVVFGTAVNSVGAPADTNTVGAVGIAQVNQGPGFTDGPDLIDATFDPATGQVTFFFDEPLFGTLLVGPFTPQPGNFFVVNSGGGTTVGTAALDIQDNQVTIQFPAAAVVNAVGAGVDNSDATGPGVGGDATFDRFGNQNSPNAVGRGPVAP